MTLSSRRVRPCHDLKLKKGQTKPWQESVLLRAVSRGPSCVRTGIVLLLWNRGTPWFYSTQDTGLVDDIWSTASAAGPITVVVGDVAAEFGQARPVAQAKES